MTQIKKYRKRKTRKNMTTKKTRKIVKRKTRKIVKRKSRNYFFKGGVNTLKLEPLANQVYSFPPGCNNASTCAQGHTDTMNTKQNDLNNVYSGGNKKYKKKITRRFRKSRRFFGGDSGDYYSCEDPNLNIVPIVQFSNSGPDVSPLNANNSSVTTNSTLISGKNNAMNDCYATDSCPP